MMDAQRINKVELAGGRAKGSMLRKPIRIHKFLYASSIQSILHPDNNLN